jgi:dipeptidase
MRVFNFKTRSGLLAILFFILAVSRFLLSLSPQSKPAPQTWDERELGCTSIMAGRLATTDGSVITAHSCDGYYRQWLNIVPAATHVEGATTTLYAGKMHNETPEDSTGVSPKGEIPEVAETYAFLNTAYPCLNEHQLAIGETTFGGRKELYNSSGLFMIEELERIMLERCTTARDAIRLAGALVKQYGYGDMGECITIADKKEVWQFEIMGAGLREKGAVWAAVRIPDDHVGVSANIPRISELHLEYPDRYMASDNVFAVATEKGWWDPKSGKPFRFWEAYGGQKPYSTRELFIFSTLAPSLKLTMEMEELPFSVKPEKKVSVREILRFYRETYDGTALDMTKNLLVQDRKGGGAVKSPVANPWMSRDMLELLNSLKPGVVERSRTIAIAGCSYATVIQCRSWLPDPVGGVCWFAFDNPAQSARIPIFAGVTDLPPNFKICAQHRFRTDSAAWAFRRAIRLATVRWGDTKPLIEAAIKGFEDTAFEDLPYVEKRAIELYGKGDNLEDIKKTKEFLTRYTGDFAHAAICKYWELGDKFWTMFARGF